MKNKAKKTHQNGSSLPAAYNLIVLQKNSYFYSVIFFLHSFLCKEIAICKNIFLLNGPLTRTYNHNSSSYLCVLDIRCSHRNNIINSNIRTDVIAINCICSNRSREKIVKLFFLYVQIFGFVLIWSINIMFALYTYLWFCLGNLFNESRYIESKVRKDRLNIFLSKT